MTTASMPTKLWKPYTNAANRVQDLATTIIEEWQASNQPLADIFLQANTNHAPATGTDEFLERSCEYSAAAALAYLTLLQIERP